MRIFVSYRREDSSAWAGRLRDALAVRFGQANIFQDVAAVRPGEDFTDAIGTALSRSDAALAVIGPNWLSAASAHGEPRLADKDDYVRRELVAALAQHKLVIPVLVRNAAMPSAAELADELKPLALLQAVSLRDETWHQDLEGLIDALGGEQPQARPRRWLTITALLTALLAAGGVAALQFDRDDTNQSSTTLVQSAEADQSATSFDPSSELPDCPPTTASEWIDLGVTGTTEMGVSDAPVGRIDVIDGRYRVDEDRWNVVLSTRYTNRSNSSQFHYWWFYELSVGGLRFEPYCFTHTGGQNPVGTGLGGDALVGFDITVDPASGAALNIDNAGDVGRVVLIPT